MAVVWLVNEKLERKEKREKKKCGRGEVYAVQCHVMPCMPFIALAWPGGLPNILSD